MPRVRSSRWLAAIFREPIDLLPTAVSLTVFALQLTLFATVHEPFVP